MDYLVAAIFPEEGAESIQEIRHAYDPTARLIAPHIPVLHPVPEDLGSEKVLDHLAGILNTWAPFEIRLGGLHRTKDHWLLLTLEEGSEEVESLCRRIYSGVLAGRRHSGPDIVPHVGLGLFVREGDDYDMFDPTTSSFDAAAYEEALERASQLKFEVGELVTELQVVRLPGAVMEWASGERTIFADDLRVEQIAKLELSAVAP